MANVKISQLPTTTTVTAADLLPVVQDGVTKQVTPDQMPLGAAQAATLAGAISATGATASDPTRLPFAAKSPWRLGISQNAQFAAASDARNVALGNVDAAGQAWINFSQYSHPISYAATDSSDPNATITDTAHTDPTGIPAGGSWIERTPTAARIAAGTDRHMHVIAPDRTSIYEHFGTVRTDTTHYTVTRRHQVSLYGSGIGPQNGTRAYGGSAIGGLIRGWEIDPANPAYTGRIDHPLAIAIRADQALYTGSDPQRTGGTGDAYGPDGYGLRRGYVWPATEQDYLSSSNYHGPIPMGSYFAIPATLDLTTLGLTTTAGMMLAKACQDYGAYVTDTSGTTNFYVEDDGSTVSQNWVNTLYNTPSYSATDLKILFKALRVVTSNAPESPNGGPLSAPRRGVAPAAYLPVGAQAADTAKLVGITVTGTPAAGQALVASSATAASWTAPTITGQYIGSAATFAGLPTTDAAGQPVSNGDWAFLTADAIGTGTATAPQYPRGAYISNGTVYTLAVTLGADFLFGTTAGTIAAGNDARIVGAAQTANNLSDLASAATARTNLGLGTAATQPTSAFDAAGAATAVSSPPPSLVSRSVTMVQEPVGNTSNGFGARIRPIEIRRSLRIVNTGANAFRIGYSAQTSNSGASFVGGAYQYTLQPGDELVDTSGDPSAIYLSDNNSGGLALSALVIAETVS